MFSCILGFVLCCIMGCFSLVQEEGRPLWTDGSPHNLTDNVMSLLPANQTGCFALQRNATGSGYVITPFFCNIALPFICQFQGKFITIHYAHLKIRATICPNAKCHSPPSIILQNSRGKCVKIHFFNVLYSFTAPPLPPSFSFDLVQVAEQQIELCWSDLSGLISLNISSFEIFLRYREEEDGELFQGEQRERRQAHKKESGSSAKKVVEVPISLSCRRVTVAGLSPGSAYSFTLRAAHPDGSSWTLGQTRTAYTSQSHCLSVQVKNRHARQQYLNVCVVCFGLFFRTSFSSKYYCWLKNCRSDSRPLDNSRHSSEVWMDVSRTLCGHVYRRREDRWNDQHLQDV